MTMFASDAEHALRSSDHAFQGAAYPAFGRNRSREARPDADRHWSQLMAHAQAGDRRAYDRLLGEVVPYIRNIASRHHRTPDHLDDVTQEVLLTLHRARDTYDSTRPFRYWLASIARRRSIDALRMRTRRAAHEIGAGAAGFDYECYADPAAHRLEDPHPAADHLGKAIASLPALQREAIELLKLRGLSLADASKLTGRSVAALKVNTFRAVKSLQRQFQTDV